MNDTDRGQRIKELFEQVQELRHENAVLERALVETREADGD